MRMKLPESFEELLERAYGHPQPEPNIAERTDDLLANYYGKPLAARTGARPAPPEAPSLSLSCWYDNRELLPQRTHAVAVPFGGAVAEEYVFDVLPSEVPPKASDAAGSPEPEGRPSVSAVDALAEAKLPSVKEPTPTQVSKPIAPPAVSPSANESEASDVFASAAAPASPEVSTDNFEDDVKAILSGQMLYDPRSKKTVPPAQLKADDAVAAPDPAPKPNQGDAFFDKLAKSMQYANAYDIGTVELEKRLHEFDSLDAAGVRASKAPAARRADTAARRMDATGARTAEFVEDLDAVLKPRGSVPTSVSRPFFDTGEHVLVGGKHYVDQLRVGTGAGVPFSYGQLIAMADLFPSVDEMMRADPQQLGRVKSLIERSTEYYRGKKSDPSKNVADSEWDTVTGGGYLKLAESNFEHFSPNFLFRNSPLNVTYQGDNRSAWEAHHSRAIRAAQEVGLQTGADQTSRLLPLEWPLIINAFGDHFLTDAFAAGHLINKDFLVALWKAQFFNAGALTGEAKSFFRRLADRAFALGQVKAQFSKLETVRSYYLFFHPNIDSPERFASVLSGIAEREPERIANMVVKAVHDRLNADGVEVFNNAGDGTWTLRGDGQLDATNRAIIERAVDQSIANINDPSILASNVDFAAYFAKVWKHVPQLTAASEAQVQRLVREYVNPDGSLLVEAAAQLISDKLDVLVRELIKAGALRKA